MHSTNRPIRLGRSRRDPLCHPTIDGARQGTRAFGPPPRHGAIQADRPGIADAKNAQPVIRLGVRCDVMMTVHDQSGAHRAAKRVQNKAALRVAGRRVMGDQDIGFLSGEPIDILWPNRRSGQKMREPVGLIGAQAGMVGREIGGELFAPVEPGRRITAPDMGQECSAETGDAQTADLHDAAVQNPHLQTDNLKRESLENVSSPSSYHNLTQAISNQ